MVLVLWYWSNAERGTILESTSINISRYKFYFKSSPRFIRSPLIFPIMTRTTPTSFSSASDSSPSLFDEEIGLEAALKSTVISSSSADCAVLPDSTVSTFDPPPPPPFLEEGMFPYNVEDAHPGFKSVGDGPGESFAVGEDTTAFDPAEGRGKNDLSSESLLREVTGSGAQNLSSVSFSDAAADRGVGDITSGISAMPSTMRSDSEDLAGFSSKRTLRSRSALVHPGRFRSPDVVKTRKVIAKKEAIPLVKLFVSSATILACGGRVGQGKVQVCVADPSEGGVTCAVTSHAQKESSFLPGRVYIRTPLARKSTVYLVPSVAVDEVDPDVLLSVMYTEHTVQFWSSLVPRLPLLTLSETREFVASLDASTKHREDFLTSPKAARKASTNVRFNFPVDLFAEVEDHSFATVWPLMRDRLIALSQATITLGRVWNTSSDNPDELNGLKTELGLLRDSIGSSTGGLGDVPLRSAWEGIHFVDETVRAFVTKALPVLQQQGVADARLDRMEIAITRLLHRAQSIEAACQDRFRLLDTLNAFCSGDSGQPTGSALVRHFRNILDRLQRLEASPGSLGNAVLPPPSSSVETKLAALSAELASLRDSHHELTTRMGNEAVEIGGIQFQSLHQTIAWVRDELPSFAYFVFQDTVTLLDMIGSTNRSDDDFLGGQFKASRANFVNDTAARSAASFDREIPTLFGRVEPTATGGEPVSTHPLPLLKLYNNFNAPDNLSGVKQRVLSGMSNTVAKVTADMAQRLAGTMIAHNVAANFLLKSQQVIFSLLTWMDNFHQELQSGGQSSSKDAWLLVCSCVRGFFKELSKVRAPAAVASSYQSDDAAKAGSYIWAMAQSHRVAQDFMSHHWREHSAIAGVINYHLFKFMTPSSTHNLLKEEVASLKRLDREKQAEISKLQSRLIKVEKK